MRALPLWYSAALLVVGVLLQVLVGRTWGIVFIVGGVLGLMLKLRIRQLDRKRRT